MKKHIIFQIVFTIFAGSAYAESTGATFYQKSGDMPNQASPDGWTISQEGKTGKGNAADKRISIGTESKYTNKKTGLDIFTGESVSGSESATISVGNETYKRQIKNVEKGIDENDAVNVSQLKGLKTYTDNQTSGIKDAAVTESKTYTDNQTSGIKDAAVTESKAYTDNQTSGIKDAAVTESKTYTDNQTSGIKDAAVTESKTYTDNQTSGIKDAAVTESKAYTDNQTSGIKDAAVTESKAYTDNQTSGIKDAAVTESKTYTDNQTSGIKDAAVTESKT
ncbi:hypothetical protein OQE50_24380 (plasmid) [Enterobacter kobei]|uniref:hypothetical protein n=1 Tax=Enterobacter kobei TaxID=208224 RepID=UPI00224AE0A7|nr:hypothetical protein [Enterobacter kobei]UZQ70290.1 hypothetical protein OQE50_24380 [Enterobacter kobei]